MPSLKTLLTPIINLGKDILNVYWTLLKIMIPAIIIVKFLDEIGATHWLALALSPAMTLLGLPDSMGIVWATSILTNIYTAMAVYFQLSLAEPLSIAQVTVLGTLILIAHALPMEGTIAKVLGVSWRVTILLRIGGAYVLGLMMSWAYKLTDTLQAPSQIMWKPEAADSGLLSWFGVQIETLIGIFFILTTLMIFLKILKVIGIEKWMHWLLSPLLKILGIGREATNITIVGMLLGLSYGGGILIKEAREGLISKRDIFLSTCLLSLCHSLIEDTLLIALLGANISSVLWIRLFFSIAVVAVMARLAFIHNKNVKETMP